MRLRRDAQREAAKRPAAKNKFASADDERRAAPAAQPVVAEAPYWTARPVVSPRLQPAHPEHTAADRSFGGPPGARRPETGAGDPSGLHRSKLPAFGAGGSDGGGFGFALLLVPFALALVDSARRSVRDIAPPMGRAHRSRQERPG